MISVVVVSHNAEQYLPRCLDSLGGPDADGLEVLVVDNASSDRSLELVQGSFPYVRVLALDNNVGFAAANNRGVAETRGEAILLLNPDSWLHDDCLARLRSALDNDPNLALAAPSLVYPDGRPQFVWAPDRSVVGEAVQTVRNRFEARQWSHRQVRWILQRFLGPGWYSAAVALLRRSAFEAVGGFDDAFFMYFEDVDLCIRLRQAGWRLGLVETATACHVGGGSPRSAETALAHRKAQLHYYRKHRPAWETRFLLRHLRRKYRQGPVAEWVREQGSGSP